MEQKSAQWPDSTPGRVLACADESSGCLDLLVTFGSSQIAVAIIHTKKQTIVNNVTAPAAIERELCR
jgi:hypothetical protein